MVFVKVIEAKGLMPNDPNGLCDPYCVMGLADHVTGDFMHRESCVRSETKRWTLDPVWKKAFLDLKMISCKVRIEIWDRDEDKPDDFLGFVVFDVDMLQAGGERWISLRARKNGLDTPQARWISLQSRKDNEPVSGQVKILVTATAVEDTFLPKTYAKEDHHEPEKAVEELQHTSKKIYGTRITSAVTSLAVETVLSFVQGSAPSLLNLTLSSSNEKFAKFHPQALLVPAVEDPSLTLECLKTTVPSAPEPPPLSTHSSLTSSTPMTCSSILSSSYESSSPTLISPIISPNEQIRRAASENMQQRMVRVFLSSTFVDMHEEREAIMRHVMVDVNDFCYKRGVSLTYIDMRWGITTDMTKQTILRCLQEVDHARPYFVGILAQRYGWHQETDGDDTQLTQTFELAESEPAYHISC